MHTGLRYRIEDDTVALHLEGDYPPGDLLELLEGALADPTAARKILLLIDARLAQVARSTDEVQGLVRAFAAHVDRFAGVAVVVDSDLHFGLARMGSVFAQEFGLAAEIFREVDEAAAFLQALKEPA